MVEQYQSLLLSESELRSVVDRLRDDWAVRAVEGIRGSANSLYSVDVATGGGQRTLVCKCCQGTEPAAFRPEPYLLGVLGRRTSIPVPHVVATVDDHEAAGGPLFLMEGREGDGVATDARELDPAVRERVAVDAGRYLGQLHDIGSFERFGSLRLARDVDRDGGGSEGAADATGDGIDVAPDATGGGAAEPAVTAEDTGGAVITVEADADDKWRDRFRALTGFYCSNLDDRFADLAEPIRDAVDERIDGLGGEEPVLTHNDYTYWNLLVDRDTGETTAVLDFENKWTAPAEYNLAATIDNLSALAPLDSPRRRCVREALYAGYEETNSLDRGGAFEARRDLYRLATRLSSLVYFESGLVVGPDDPDALAREHREFVEQFR